jgi:hypothetical protein
MTKIKRRQFVKGLAALPCIGSLPARASNFIQRGTPQKILHLRCVGGWDQSLIFDPKPNSALVAQQTGNSVQQISSTLSYGAHAARPEVDTFFSNQSTYSQIVNGIHCKAIEHDAALTSAYSDQLNIKLKRGSDRHFNLFSAYAAVNGPASLIPHMILGASHQKDALDSYTAILTDGFLNNINTGGMVNLISSSRHDLIRNFIANKLANYSITLGNHGIDAEKNNTAALSFARTSPTINALKTAIASSSASSGTTDRRIDLAKYFLENSLAQVATVDVGTRFDWDTHRQNDDQQNTAFNSLFASLNRLMSSLDSSSLKEDLVIIVSSELGRTPYKNSNNGKDHWPYSSALIWSPELGTSKTIGSTDDELRGNAIDLLTNQSDTDGSYIEFQNILAAIALKANVYIDEYSATAPTPLEALLL